MPRSVKGLYKRGRRWWMTYMDALNIQRFEPCKTTNRKRANTLLLERHKEALEGLLPEPPIKPLALDDLKTRYLAVVAHQRGIVVTALHTGMIKSEILGLTWDRVNMIHGNIRLTQTKNGKARAIPFNMTLWAEFTDLRTRLDVPWVFHDTAGRRYNDVRHAFDRAMAKAGIQDFTFHDLRHTFASWLAMKSVPLNTTGTLLGHSSPTMTLKYAHLSPGYLTSAVRVLDTVSSPLKKEVYEEGTGSSLLVDPRSQEI